MQTGPGTSTCVVYKYHREIATCEQPCPRLVKYREQSRTAYRWVRDPVSDGDFEPVALDPDRTDDQTKCEAWALSFWNSYESARTRWESLAKRVDAEAAYGTHVCEVNLTPADGVMCDPSSSGHIGLHEYATVSGWAKRARGVQPIRVRPKTLGAGGSQTPAANEQVGLSVESMPGSSGAKNDDVGDADA